MTGALLRTPVTAFITVQQRFKLLQYGTDGSTKFDQTHRCTATLIPQDQTQTHKCLLGQARSHYYTAEEIAPCSITMLRQWHMLPTLLWRLRSMFGRRLPYVICAFL